MTTFVLILKALPVVAAIIGAITNLWKMIFVKTPEQQSQQNIVDEQNKETAIEQTGRPQ